MDGHYKLLWKTSFLVVVVGVGARADLGPASRPATSAPTGPLLEGIVLNYFGGGIPGALVRIESLDASADEPPLAEGATNRTGRIMIRLPQRVETAVRVRIQKEGYAEHLQEIEPGDPDEPAFIDATLEGAATLTGTVRVRDTHRPVAAALVRCDNGGRTIEARTDAGGRYTLDNVLQGPARLTVFADGYAVGRKALVVELDEEQADIELGPERLVELAIVTDQGQPADQVAVEALVEPGHNYLSAMTDARGRVTLHGVGPAAEKIRLKLNGDRYVRMTDFSQTIDLAGSRPAATLPAPGPTPITWRAVVTLAARVWGQVADSKTARPIVGVRVIAGPAVRSAMPMAWTGLNGTYELTGLPAGNNVISFQHARYAVAIREVQLNTGQATRIDAQLDPGLPVSGRVVDEGGEPLEGVWVSAEEWKGYATLGLRAITSEDGRFSLGHAPPGDTEFSFLKPGYGRATRQVLTAGKTDYRIVLAASSAPPGAPPDVNIPVGRTVPELTMTATDGTVYTLSQLRGKYVFLDFWVSWCKPCAREAPHVRILREATRNRADFVLIGVSLDEDRKAFKEFVAKHELDWPQVFGPRSGAEETFEILDGFGVPYTCLIGPDGKMLAQHIFGPTTVEQVREHLPE